MIPVIPPQHAIKAAPTAAEIYQLDASPLEQRQPVLLVHGLKDEYMRMFHWQHVCKYLTSNEAFRKHYKIYLARYSTAAPEKQMAASFKPALRELASVTGHPVIVVALSISGNIIRDTMDDPAVDQAISRLITMGAPFHGSPLFSKDWMQYSFFKHYKWSPPCVDRCIFYSIYFKFHPNLQREYYWDNCDQQLPAVGPYRFTIPIPVKGDLAPPTNPPPAASVSNGEEKIIAYAGYLNTRFIPNHPRSRAKAFIQAVASFFNTTVPTHLGRQRAVVRALNFEMASLKTAKNVPAPYALNDGISTVASSLSLPAGEAVDVSCDDDRSMAKIQSQINVSKARIFQNIDHLTFIDGHRPLKGSNDNIVDRLSPKEKPRPMFAWLLGDILK